MNYLTKLILSLSLIGLLSFTASAQIKFEDSGQQLGNACSWSAQLADIDNDGDLDAVVRNNHYQVPQVNRIWLNDGTGRFTAVNQNLEDADFTLGDIDGDGDTDILLAGKILINDGHGSFTEQSSSFGRRASGVTTLGDLDNDGDLDAFIIGTNQYITIWLNDGTGNFSDTQQNLQGTGSSGAFLGDLDNDGDLDAFICCGPDTPSVPGNPNLIFFNNGSGCFTDSNQRLGNAASVDAAVGDLNNDGYLDIVVANYHSPPNAGNQEQTDELYINNGDGTFSEITPPFSWEISRGVELGDLESDGDLDIYFFHSNGSVYGRPDKVWINNGQGLFADSGLRIGNSTSGNGALGDLDGDGDPDVFIPVADFNRPGGANRVYLNQSTLEFQIEYGSYIGGRHHEDGGAFLNLDGQGRVYVMLNTASNDCPTTPGAFDESYNGGTRFDGYGGDIYAAKLSEDGDSLVYGTYVGGTDHEFHSYFSKVDVAGHLYVFGMTRSTDFPTTAGAFDRTFNSTPGSDDPDVFLFKLDPNTGYPVWSTYIGGRNWEAAADIALGPEGSVYVTGVTNSPDFPTTPGCYDSVYSGDYEVFVCKFDASGQMKYSTLLGISDTFRFGQADITVDELGCAWIAKNTGMPRLAATADALDRTYNGGESDIYLMKLNALGSDIIYRSYFGGRGTDSGTVNIADDGMLRITGDTTSSNFPLTEDAFDKTYRLSGRSFYAKIDPGGTELIFSTFISGSFAGRLGESLILMQHTNSGSLPVTQHIMEVPFNQNNNIYISVIDSETGRLVYATYIGGSRSDGSLGLCAGPDGGIWLGCATDSSDLPTTEGALTLRHNNIGYQDGYIIKLSPVLENRPGSTDFPVSADAYSKTRRGETDAVFAGFAFGEIEEENGPGNGD